MRPVLVTVVARLLAILAGLLIVGIVVRLLGAVLRPVLPPELMTALDAGWDTLLALLAPAFGPIMAILILAALVWIAASRRQ